MSDQTSVSGSAIPLPPAIPGGDEVYNGIMGAIEPELMTDALPTLAAKYAQETQEQRDARMERYKKAFLAYGKAYQEFVQKQDGALRKYKSSVMGAVEHNAGAEDTTAMRNFESLIANPSL